jgi:RNA polymerase subunit RPABC4/transcription elongation factor Spt4
MVQICPSCRRLVSDEETVCPYCNRPLTPENKTCPFCKNQITDEDTVCPHCNSLLIYEHQDSLTAERNRVLFPTGFILLFAAIFYVMFQSRFNAFMHGLFYVAWLTGFVIFCVYIGKGDRDFWWGR